MINAATSTGGNVDTQCTRDYASDFRTTRKFKSKDELTTWARDVGRSKGFVIVTFRSDSGAGKKRPSVTLSCERSGKWDKRNSYKETKKCGCPFRLKGKKVAADDEWELKVDNGRHNHEAGQAKEGHSFAGKLSKEEKSLLKRMTSEGEVQPKEILTTLIRRDKHSKSTLRTVYNGCQRLRVLRELEGSNLRLQQLMRKASEYNYIEKHRLNPKTDTVLEFFCTRPTSLELLSAFPRVLGITCKNYGSGGMWQLYIFGITSTDIKFLVAFAILSLERKSSWGWALSTLRGAMDDKGVAMPDVIILTDIGFGWASSTLPLSLKRLTKAIEDVFSPAKLLFYKSFINAHVPLDWWKIYGFQGPLSFKREWDLLVESPTEAEYDEQLKRLHTECMYPESLAYVTNTLLKPYKEKFVAAWTDNIMHFGYTREQKLGAESALLSWLYYISKGGPESPDTFWKDMDASLENVHKRIKASFVECLTNETNEDEEYRELRGVVSISALRKIREQTMPIEEEDTYHTVCNCAIKRTHGLPCTHEIAKYRAEGRPIPLDCIHPHWKKLDLEPLTRTAESGVDKMTKMNNSTPSAPLLSEIVESRQRNSPNAGLSIVHSNQERQPEAEDKVYHNQSTKPLEFVHAFPAIWEEYIINVKDVARDGHCGFRAIASMCNSDEDGWVKVRKDLIDELKSNKAHYALLFGSFNRVNQLHHAVNYFGSPCLDHEHWMTIPDMGHIIASCYNVILIHLSSVQCFTFFPLRTVPISASSPIEIAIGLVNEHFVQVFLKPGHPMPPIPPDLTQKRKNIPPVTDWETTLEQRCTEWASKYYTRMEHYKSLQAEIVRY